jgi:hypothetical protein
MPNSSWFIMWQWNEEAGWEGEAAVAGRDDGVAPERFGYGFVDQPEAERVARLEAKGGSRNPPLAGPQQEAIAADIGGHPQIGL